MTRLALLILLPLLCAAAQPMHRRTPVGYWLIFDDYSAEYHPLYNPATRNENP